MLKELVNEWMDDNEKRLENLWDFLESGHVYNLAAASRDQRMGKSCTPISKLTPANLMRLLREPGGLRHLNKKEAAKMKKNPRS